MSSAWDIKAGKKVWSINEKFPVWSGVLATAGDVVFYGTMDGWFKAVDAKTGWQFKTSSGIIGQPTSMRLVVISAKNRSPRLSHDALVGVKCSLKRGCLASHAFTSAALIACFCQCAKGWRLIEDKLGD